MRYSALACAALHHHHPHATLTLLSPQNRLQVLAVGYEDGVIVLYRAEGGKVMHALPALGGAITALAWAKVRKICLAVYPLPILLK